MNDQPQRTNWHRANSQHYCICNATIKAGLQREGCCNSTWGRYLCEEVDCTVDCTSTAALQCLQDCRTKCHLVHPRVVTTECLSTCLDANSRCHDYKVCPPQEPLNYSYVCLNGQAPQQNGCCQEQVQQPGAQPQQAEVCPSLCRIRHHYNFQHGRECQCFGCPESTSQVDSTLRATVLQEQIAVGQTQLTNVARQYGLRDQQASEEMIAINRERNTAIREAFSSHNGSYDARLTQQIQALNAQYADRILRAAGRARDCQQRGQNCPAPATSTGSDDDNSTVVIVSAVCGSVVLLLLGFVGALLFMRRKRSSSGQTANPVPGDTNVVVGRPVENTGGDATSGAPVATSSQPEEPSTKQAM